MLHRPNATEPDLRIPSLTGGISAIVTFDGGIISPLTPPGLGLGRTPQRQLKPDEPDEEITIKIEGVGILRNTTRVVK